MANALEKIILGLVVVLIFGISSFLIGAQTSDDSVKVNAPQQSSSAISPENAKIIALSAVPGAITDFEYGVEGKIAVYEVEIESNGKKNEIIIDKNAGSIISIETEEDDDSDIVLSEIESRGIFITEEKARQIAIGAVGGSVLGISKEKEGGIILYEIEMQVNGEKAEVEINAENGEVIEIEWGDD